MDTVRPNSGVIATVQKELNRRDFDLFIIAKYVLIDIVHLALVF